MDGQNSLISILLWSRDGGHFPQLLCRLHSLIFSKYTQRHDIPEEYKRIFHLGCFAPDSVSSQYQKKETYMGFGLNRIPLFFRRYWIFPRLKASGKYF